MNCLDSRVFDVIVPSSMFQWCVGFAPWNEEHGIALLDRIPHQWIAWLQIKNVILVDARRNNQQRPLMHCFCQRLVLNQLKQFIFENHCALPGRNIFTHFKSRFIRLRDMPFFYVGKHACNAFHQTLAIGFDNFLLRLWIRHQKIGRGHCIDHLLHGKTDFLFCFWRNLNRVCHRQQKTCIQQISCSIKRGKRIGMPRRCVKTLIGHSGCFGNEKILPQRGELLCVFALQLCHYRRVNSSPQILNTGCNQAHVGRRLLEPSLPDGRIGQLRHPFRKSGLRIQFIHAYISFLAYRYSFACSSNLCISSQSRGFMSCLWCRLPSIR